MSNRKEANVSSDLLVLLALRERMSDENNWCQHSFEKDNEKRCMVGHLVDILNLPILDCWSEEQFWKVNRYVKKMGFYSLGSAFIYNDGHKHHEVLKIIDKAIKRERGT